MILFVVFIPDVFGLVNGAKIGDALFVVGGREPNVVERLGKLPLECVKPKPLF